MKHTHTKAVALPVDEVFLAALERRRDTLTTLIWGWQGKSGRMVEPHRILDKDQPHLPFLFSPTEQESKAATHAALCGRLVHREELSAEVEECLHKRRVENFVGIQPGRGVASLYVVTAAVRLSPAIAYGQLVLVKGGTALSPDKRRGYSVVYLPATLQGWFDEACRQWDALSAELPEMSQ